jgi:biotin carboxyl carrier protein
MDRVERVGNGVYRVEVDGRMETVYVAGPPHDRWAFCDGRVFRGDFSDASSARRTADEPGTHALAAPMPATVISVHVKPGDRVVQGQLVMLLEAMKMELPIRAPRDGVVSAVHRRAGELVQADAPLLDLES